MTSVNEDEEIANHLSPPREKSELKIKDPRSCNERSDSGFSECSNCSTPSASCVCNLTLLDKTQSIIEEQSNSSNESEETMESIQPETEEKTATADESFTVSSDHDVRSEISSLEYDDANKSPCDDNQNVVVSIRVPTRRELYQDEHGDLLGEVERRKVSLEKKTSAACKHEVYSEKLRKTSKVALLMEKFEASSCSLPSFRTKSTAVTNGLNTNLDFDDVKMFDVTKSPIDDNSKTNINESSFFTAKSNSPTRNATNPTTFRLSSRVREVTERLSRPKQTSLDDTPTKNSILKQNSSAFARSKDFWKR